jgi:hypothetical protein
VTIPSSAPLPPSVSSSIPVSNVCVRLINISFCILKTIAEYTARCVLDLITACAGHDVEEPHKSITFWRKAELEEIKLSLGPVRPAAAAPSATMVLGKVTVLLPRLPSFELSPCPLTQEALTGAGNAVIELARGKTLLPCHETNPPRDSSLCHK